MTSKDAVQEASPDAAGSQASQPGPSISPRRQSWDLQRALQENPPVLHPLGGGDVDTLLAQLRGNGHPYSERSRWQRLMALGAVATRVPFSGWDKVFWSSRIRELSIPEDPVFIVGHWRSGTTLLHQLLSQDPQFRFLDFGQMVTPHDMLGNIRHFYRFLVSKVLPEDRGYDRVKLDLGAPQEEEIALASLNRLSYYRAYYFPRNMRRYFDESVLFDGVEARELQDFEHAYLQLVKMLTLAEDGKRLLFKNPSSTARLTLLKRIFPGAKFIYVHRNPYEVFASSLHRYPRLMAAFAWEPFEEIDFRSMVYYKYQRLLQAYLDQVEEIPPEDRVETFFEAFTGDPEQEVGRIYEELDLPGVEVALESVRSFAQKIRSYRRNLHEIEREDVERIPEEWAFSLQRWPYGLSENLNIID